MHQAGNVDGGQGSLGGEVAGGRVDAVTACHVEGLSRLVRLRAGHGQKIDLILRQARRRIGEQTGRDRLQGGIDHKDRRVLRIRREIIGPAVEPVQTVDPARQQQPLAAVGS